MTDSKKYSKLFGAFTQTQTKQDSVKVNYRGFLQTNDSRAWMAFLHLVAVCSALSCVFFAMRCLFSDSNHFVCFNVISAWHLSFHRDCLPDRERGAHTKSVYGGGRLKAIIIYLRMRWSNGGSVKAFSKKEAPWMAAMHKHASCRAALKPDALGDRCCQKRQRDKDAAEFYIRKDTKG